MEDLEEDNEKKPSADTGVVRRVSSRIGNTKRKQNVSNIAEPNTIAARKSPYRRVATTKLIVESKQKQTPPLILLAAAAKHSSRRLFFGNVALDADKEKDEEGNEADKLSELVNDMKRDKNNNLFPKESALGQASSSQTTMHNSNMFLESKPNTARALGIINPKSTTHLLKYQTKENLFRNFKFLDYDALNFSNSEHSICRQLANSHSIPAPEIENWWSDQKNDVATCFKNRRNNVIKAISMCFEDMMIKKGGKQFGLSDIENMRSSESRTMYTHFLAQFGGALVGHIKWKEARITKKLMEYFTVSDEAFLLLCYECYQYKWRQLYNTNHNTGVSITETEDTKVEPTFLSKVNGTKKAWTIEGKERFNHYMKRVCLDRKANGAMFDIKVLKYWKKAYAKEKRMSASQMERAMEKAKERRFETYNDNSINRIMQLPHGENIPDSVAATWGDDDEIGEESITGFI